MEYLFAAFAGLAATLLLTTLMNMAGMLGSESFNVPAILGSLVTMSTRPSGRPSFGILSKTTGYVIHYCTGILITLIYYQLWNRGIGAPDLSGALRFGTVTGLLAMLCWFVILKLHPLAPAIALLPFLVFIFFAHLIYAIAVTYAFLTIQCLASLF